MLISISNTPREYSWGSTTLIPAFEGRDASGAPEAEVWYGDHPGSPSRTPDGRTLDTVLKEAGADPLPYLLKVLAAGSSLSIQAHPSKAEALEGFAREEAAGIPRDAADRTYRDDNHKPEIIVALSERFRALVGLRPLARTRRLVAALGDGVGPTALAVRLGEGTGSGGEGDGHFEALTLRGVIAWALSGSAQDEVDDIARAIADADDPEFPEEFDVLRNIIAHFPADAGVVVALLMNLVVLRAGEALFAPAGVLHAYQDGLGVELMAASDNVLRGGLTPKYVDVPELLRIVDTTPAEAPVLTPVDRGGVDVYDVGVPDFSLMRVRADGRDGRSIEVAGPTIVLATSGHLRVEGASGAVDLRPGQAAFASADEGELRLGGTGEAFVARPGDTPS